MLVLPRLEADLAYPELWTWGGTLEAGRGSIRS